MSCLYVTEQGAVLSLEQGKIVVSCKDGSRRLIPEQTLESVVLFGNVSLTLPVQKRCLELGVSVTLLSNKGHYYGRLMSTSHFNAQRLKKQVYLSDNENEKLDFAKRILGAKIHNQRVLLSRYARNSDADISVMIHEIKQLEMHISKADTIDRAMGYEGAAARKYFEALSKMVKPDFAFFGRNRRPPKDAFNAMLSLGYTILFYEIYPECENRSLSPYVGFIHRIKENHPALVSDMLEEWRAVIVDSTVMSMIQGNEVSIDEFEISEDSPGVFLKRSALKSFTRKLENKMRSDINYLEYLDHPVSFRRAIWWQIKCLSRCIDEEDLSTYEPLRIR